MTEQPVLKRCPKCGASKPHEAFSKDRTKKDGRQSHCKDCVNARDMREHKRAYDIANADKISARKQRYYAEKREELRQKHRDYYAANADAILERQHNFYMQNSERILARNRAAERENREARRIISHRRRARKKGNGGTFTKPELVAMRAAQNGHCPYCQLDYHPDALTIDHIIPIEQGGRHEAANICLACERCNKSKGNRTPEQWVDRWYLRTPKPRVDRRKRTAS